jgi:hypothetical protein
MAIATPKRLYTGQPGTTATTIYTVPPNTTTIIKSIVMANTNAAASTITIGINGTGAANQIVPTVYINPNDSKIVDGINLVLNTGDTLQALQGTAGAVTLTVSGAEVS